MLSPYYLLNRIKPITDMYSDLHTAILADIARHIADTLKATGKAGLIPSAAYEVERLNRAGMLREDIIKEIARISRMSRKEIRQLFTDAAVETRIYDDRIYKAAGLEPIPIMQSPENLKILEAGISKTMGSVERLTGTIATNAETRFNELLNLGYNKVSSGAMSYTRAIEDTVAELTREGVKVFSYTSDREISVESAVRMNILTGANQTAAKIIEETMREMGASLVRTSAHLGARNTDVDGKPWANHESWQGKVFHWKEMDKGDTMTTYPDFIKSTGYGDVAGLCGANCRHSFGVYIEGVSPETYSDADLDKFANETVTYTDPETGEKVTTPYYDSTQKLRDLERHIRNWKRKQQINEAAGLDASAEKIKVRHWQRRAKRFCDETGLKRDYAREKIAEKR